VPCNILQLGKVKERISEKKKKKKEKKLDGQNSKKKIERKKTCP